jgi:hypothetical protein
MIRAILYGRIFECQYLPMQIFPFFSIFILNEVECNANICVLVQQSRIIRPFFHSQKVNIAIGPPQIFSIATQIFVFCFFRKVKKNVRTHNLVLTNMCNFVGTKRLVLHNMWNHISSPVFPIESYKNSSVPSLHDFYVGAYGNMYRISYNTVFLPIMQTAIFA